MNDSPDPSSGKNLALRLKNSARALPRPSASAAQAYAARAAFIATRVSAILTAENDQEALDRLIGPGNSQLMRANHENHARFMADTLADPSPEVLADGLVDAVVWVLRTYMARGFTLDYWRQQLPAFMRVVREEIPDHAGTILPVYEFLFTNLDDFMLLSQAPSAWETPPAAPAHVDHMDHMDRMGHGKATP